MLSNMLDKAVNPLGLRGIYSLFAALMCICVVGGGFGLRATPLETMSRILDFLSIPTDWISGVETYLGEDNARNQLFGIIASYSRSTFLDSKPRCFQNRSSISSKRNMVDLCCYMRANSYCPTVASGSGDYRLACSTTHYR